MEISKKDILKILKQRDPFLFVDSVNKMENGSVVASYYVDPDLYFLGGHFPGYPLMPGVLLIECLSQVFGILIVTTVSKRCNIDIDNVGDIHSFLAKVSDFRFKEKVSPGDHLTIIATSEVRVSRGFFRGSGEIRVKDKVVAKGDVLLYADYSSVIKVEQGINR